MDGEKRFQEALDELDEPAPEAEIPRRSVKKRWFIVLAVLILVFVLGWWLIGEMLGYTTYSRMQTKCANAHTFANVCMEYEKDGNTLQSGIWHIQPGKSGFEDYVLRLYSSSEGEWYGLVLDKDGKIEYALNSEVEIPSEYLTHPPDYEEQMALLDSHFAFRRKKAVAVWYTDDSRNTMRD